MRAVAEKDAGPLHLAVHTSNQPLRVGTDPDRAVGGRGQRRFRQSLARDGDMGELGAAKPVEAAVRADPDIPFPVFEDVARDVAAHPLLAQQKLGRRQSMWSGIG